jgi:hypothetical protein
MIRIRRRRLALLFQAGFEVPFYREVERVGWRWVGRVRGRNYIKLNSRWRSCKRSLAAATETPTALGIGDWVRSNPLRAAFVLVRKPHRASLEREPVPPI